MLQTILWIFAIIGLISSIGGIIFLIVYLDWQDEDIRSESDIYEKRHG